MQESGHWKEGKNCLLTPTPPGDLHRCETKGVAGKWICIFLKTKALPRRHGEHGGLRRLAIAFATERREIGSG